ncbi:MAG: alpha/beta hydrolase [Myxococcales bacterium]|nr:alpha/beta hydrolase [Myxococcales bacterium]
MARYNSFQQRAVHSFDGTRLRYQVAGAGPTVVLANGLGGFRPFWRYQVRLLARHYRLICWDYRGLVPWEAADDDEHVGSLALTHQARDLDAILRAESATSPVLLVGWSMGVQVSLEYYRLRPDAVHGIIAINGTAGRPFETAFADRRWRALIRPLLRGVRGAAPLLGRVAPRLAHWGAAEPLLHWLGAASPGIDDGGAFIELARAFSHIDYRRYAETFFELARHDAWDLLPDVQAPSLVIAGDADVLTPVEVAHRMVGSMPRAELAVLRGGSHFCAIQQSERVNELIAEFIGELGYGPFAEEPVRVHALRMSQRPTALLPAISASAAASETNRPGERSAAAAAAASTLGAPAGVSR